MTDTKMMSISEGNVYPLFKKALVYKRLPKPRLLALPKKPEGNVYLPQKTAITGLTMHTTSWYFGNREKSKGNVYSISWGKA